MPADNADKEENSSSNDVEQSPVEDKINKAQETNKDENAPKQKQQNSPWFLRAEAFNILSLLFTFVLIIIYATQAYIMKAQLAEMRSGSEDTKRLAQAAVNQATAAKDSADAAKTTIKVIQENMRLEQRAWVGVKGIRISPPPWKAEQKIEATLTVENTGRTPALEVRIIKRYGPSPPTRTMLSKPIAGLINVFSVAPTNSFDSTVTLSDKLSESELQLLASGKPYYVYGIVTYRDIFTTTIRETLFCGYYIDGFRQLQFCPIFNDMK
jgi:hypothetical protein